MEYQTIVVEKKNRVGLIMLNRPDHMNTFSVVLAKELNAALDELEQDGQIRAVIIKGTGRSFCAGIDITEFSGKTLLEYREWIAWMEKMNLTIAGMGKPVIAAVHGYTVANGTGLLAACDLAIAAEGTRIGTTAINVGLYCFGPSNALARSLGRKRSLGMLLTGDLITAQDAERFGLVNKVVAPDKLEETVHEMANKILANSGASIRIQKSLINRGLRLDYVSGLKMAEAESPGQTEDSASRLQSFRDKTWDKASAKKKFLLFLVES